MLFDTLHPILRDLWRIAYEERRMTVTDVRVDGLRLIEPGYVHLRLLASVNGKQAGVVVPLPISGDWGPIEDIARAAWNAFVELEKSETKQPVKPLTRDRLPTGHPLFLDESKSKM